MAGDHGHARPTMAAVATSLTQEVWISSELLFSNKLSWLLILGPIALVGDSTGFLGEAACFALSGIALIPCAERLSFVTEQVAEHTNGTIGALLNATFGNAPELLIATAALRSGFYRVVQLAMLGSMLTNLLFVFGLSCLVGGLKWQVQELRITSGNVSVGMLLLSVSGSLLPAALILGGQLQGENQGDQEAASSLEPTAPSKGELAFCRVNAAVMIFMYFCYLVFQLGTHKDEFDEEGSHDQQQQQLLHQHQLTPAFPAHPGNHPRRNLFCLTAYNRICRRGNATVDPVQYEVAPPDDGDVELQPRSASFHQDDAGSEELVPRDDQTSVSGSSDESGNKLLPQNESPSSYANGYFDEYNDLQSKEKETDSLTRRRRADKHKQSSSSLSYHSNQTPGQLLPLGLADPADTTASVPLSTPATPPRAEPQMSFRVGIVWLFVITLCISAMSDILVDTIDGFAYRLHISQVFTSMVIVPFFSNVAEQVSAVLFAYRNEMDLCVGVTVGSAIQVACFVLPGCVLIGWMVDRSMTLYFHAYETACLLLAVIVVAAVLQGGTTNWLVGATCIGIYMMIASGFWFHSLEDLSVDAELVGHNITDP